MAIFEIIFSVVFLNSFLLCQQSQYAAEPKPNFPKQLTTLRDPQRNIIVYRDSTESRCYIEYLNDIPKKLQLEGVSTAKLSRKQIWKLTGPRIQQFCNGYSVYVIKNQPFLDDTLNGIDLHENVLSRKARGAHHGRVRGQTQSQYLSFGQSKETGKAEAESSYGSSKAIVSGSNGMGQAQSQSSPFGCDGCYDQQALHYGIPSDKLIAGGPIPPPSGKITNGAGKLSIRPGQQPTASGVPTQTTQWPGGPIPPGGWQTSQLPSGAAWQPGQQPPGAEWQPGQQLSGVGLQPGQQPSGVDYQPGQQQSSAGLQPGLQPSGAGWQPGQQPTGAELYPGQRRTDVGLQPGQQPSVVGLQPGQQPSVVGLQPGQQPSGAAWQPGQQPPGAGWQPGQQQSGSGWQPGQQPQGPGWQPGQQPSGTGLQPGQPQSGSGWQPGQQPSGVGWQPGQQPGGSGWQPGQQPSGVGWQPGQQPGGTGWQHGQQPSGTGWQPGQQPIGGGWQPGQQQPVAGWQPGQQLSGGGWLPGQQIGGAGWQPEQRPGHLIQVQPTHTLTTPSQQLSRPADAAWLHPAGTFTGEVGGTYQSNQGHAGQFAGSFSGKYNGNGKHGQPQQYITSGQPTHGIHTSGIPIVTGTGTPAITGISTPSIAGTGTPITTGIATPTVTGTGSSPYRLNGHGAFRQPIIQTPTGVQQPHVSNGNGVYGQPIIQVPHAGVQQPHGGIQTDASGRPLSTTNSGIQTDASGRPLGTTNYGGRGTFSGTFAGNYRTQQYQHTSGQFANIAQLPPGGTVLNGHHGQPTGGITQTGTGFLPTGGYGGTGYLPTGGSGGGYSQTGHLPTTGGNEGALTYTQPSYLPTTNGASGGQGYLPTAGANGGALTTTAQGYLPPTNGAGGGPGYFPPAGGTGGAPIQAGRGQDYLPIGGGTGGVPIQGGIGQGYIPSGALTQAGGGGQSTGAIGTYQNGRQSIGGPGGAGANFQGGYTQGPGHSGQFYGTFSGVYNRYKRQNVGQVVAGPSGYIGADGTYYGGHGPTMHAPSIPSQYMNGIEAGPLQTEDDADSQAQTSIQHTNNQTQASASSQGKYIGGTAQSQVAGTYSGSGTFSASAGTDDGKRGAQTQVSGGKEGATSTAQGNGGSAQSQTQVQFIAETGDTRSQAQSNGWNHGSNTQVQAGNKGGMADAQANGPGNTQSQAQIGFLPHDENEEDEQNTPFKGGGMASAQSGTYSGQTQTQIQGKFRYGIRYTGAAQAGSGSGDNKNHTDLPSVAFKPITFQSPNYTSHSFQMVESPSTNTITQTKPSFNNGNNNVNKNVVNNNNVDLDTFTTTEGLKEERSSETVIPTKDNSDDYEEEYDDYDNTELPTTEKTKNHLIMQSTRNQRQHILLDPLENIDATVSQTQGDPELPIGTVLQPGQQIPGSSGYQIPQGFRGRVTSYASGERTTAKGPNSQAQSVKLTPGRGRIIYKKPVYSVASNTQLRNGQLGFGSGYTYQPIQYQLRSGNSYPGFVSLTKSETGSRNIFTGKKTPSVYYTQSSSCGYFTNTCIYSGGKKICMPKPRTNPDGSPIIC